MAMQREWVWTPEARRALVEARAEVAAAIARASDEDQAERAIDEAMEEIEDRAQENAFQAWGERKITPEVRVKEEHIRDAVLFLLHTLTIGQD